MNKKKYVKELIHSTERELVNCEVQCWVYQREVNNPTSISKAEAEESLKTYQKQCGHLKVRIEVYKEYAVNLSLESEHV